MSRWKAAGLHLMMSFAVVGGIALTAFLLWFPYGLHTLAGLDRLLLVMLCLDLTAGPLLTLVIYKAGKRGLRFDLTFIALCQLAFLAYGLSALWASRPVFLVGNGMRFNLVFANEIDPEQLSQASRPEWRRLSWHGPQLVGARPPADADLRVALLDVYLKTGVDLERLPRYYVPYEQVAPTMLQHAEPGQAGRRQVPIVSRYVTANMELDANGKPRRVVPRSKPALRVRADAAPSAR